MKNSGQSHVPRQTPLILDLTSARVQVRAKSGSNPTHATRTGLLGTFIAWTCCLIAPAHFGGIGKEYAVDRAYDLLAAQYAGPFLVNFGGDLRANRPPPNGPWQVGIERPDTDQTAGMVLDLERGALATSGDSRRFLLQDTVLHGHILDPRTGWPVPESPRSVTVAASSCTEAGLLSTLALLHGAQARAFLEVQGARYWLVH